VKQRLTEWWRLATLGSALLLLATVVSWQLTSGLAPEPMLLAVLFSLPILAPLPGLFRGNRYTYKWATLCVMPYFIVGLTEVIADPRSRMTSTAMLTAALAWFVGLLGYLRVSAPEKP